MWLSSPRPLVHNTHSFYYFFLKMSENAKLQMNDDMLGVVDSWLGGTDDNASGTNQPVFEKRPQRLGLGAKYVPHKKVMIGKGN